MDYLFKKSMIYEHYPIVCMEFFAVLVLLTLCKAKLIMGQQHLALTLIILN